MKNNLNEVAKATLNEIGQVSPESERQHNLVSEEEFWGVISYINPYQKEEDMLKAALIKLSRYTIEQIKSFGETLVFKLYQLDTMEHAKNIGEGSFKGNDKEFSSDNFLAARCGTIAKGMKFYNDALNDPTLMAKDFTLEFLLYLAMDAYELKTGEEWPYDTLMLAETYSNKDGWKQKS